MRDSGGVQPWGDSILIPCDCREKLPADVRCLVIAARNVAYSCSQPSEELRELDAALEAFADRIHWDDEPTEATNI